VYDLEASIFKVLRSEALGQSAYYSIQTGKKAGIVLIIETMKDQKYWIRLNSTIQHFNMPIDRWNVVNSRYEMVILNICFFFLSTFPDYFSRAPCALDHVPLITENIGSG